MLSPGQKIAHFRVTEKAGEGGMGQVYLAEDQKLNRRVALKVLVGEAFDDPDRLERFRREAKTAAQITHPNVMGIYDIDRAKDPESGRDLNYIVMEYVEGKSLSAYLRDRDHDIGSLIRVAEKIASGLAAAHRLNIVHRDIKADNIMVDSEGEPKILDFGLAKSVEAMFDQETDDSTRTVDKDDLTRAGKILGTVSYMSPEQARGEKIDTRSDIFSFGVLLYRMVTGDFPFSGSSSVSTLAKILEARHEPPRMKNANIHPELERIIDKCLRKEPGDRYQDTRDLVVDLRNLRRLYDSGASDSVSVELLGLAESKKPSPLRLGWKQGAILLAAFLVIFVAISSYLDNKSVRKPALQAKSNSLAIIGFENKTGDASLDWLETGLPEILLTDLAQAEAITIISQERILDCFPDGKQENHTFDECVDAASTLGAVNLLSGSFYKLGDKIRIDARLQEIATGNIIFGEKVVGDDPFTLVDSLTAKIAVSLNIARTMGQDRSVATYTSSSPEAYQHYLSGVDKMFLERYDEAIDEFNKALAIDSTFALPYMRIGLCHVFQGAHQEGSRYFAEAKKYEGKLPARDQALLEVYTNIWLDQQFDDAFIKMASFVKRYSDDKEAHAIYGLLVNFFTGDTTKAFAHLDTALQIDPSYQLALSQLASINRDLGRIEKAIKYAQLIKRKHPDSPEPYIILSGIYAEQGQIDDAMDELDQLLEQMPEHQQALYRESNLYIAKRDFGKAREVLERLFNVSGISQQWRHNYWRQRADIHFWNGQFNAAVAAGRQAYTDALQDADSVRIRQSLGIMANYYHLMDVNDSALYYARESHRWATAFDKVLYPLTAVGWDHTLAGELKPTLESAIDEWRRRLPPEFWRVIDNIQALFHAYGDADTAAIIEICQDTLVPEQHAAIYEGDRTLGIMQVLTGHFQEGRDNILRTHTELNDLTASDIYLPSRYHLGLAEEGLGNKKEAVRYYEEVLSYWGEADVETKMIKDIRRRLAALTG